MGLTSGSLTLDVEPIRAAGAVPIPEPPALAVLQSPALRYALVHPQGAAVSERGTSGHLIGLAHATFDHPEATMDFAEIPGDTNKRSLEADDVEAREPLGRIGRLQVPLVAELDHRRDRIDILLPMHLQLCLVEQPTVPLQDP